MKRLLFLIPSIFDGHEGSGRHNAAVASCGPRHELSCSLATSASSYPPPSPVLLLRCVCVLQVSIERCTEFYQARHVRRVHSAGADAAAKGVWRLIHERRSE